VRPLLIAFAAVSFFRRAQAVRAQTGASLSGMVTNEAGAPFPMSR